MKTTIGPFDAATRTVTATFEEGGVTHTRPVNACLTSEGVYDEEATAARVEEVARGVSIKIANGAIVNPPEPEEAPAPEDVPDEAE